MGAETKEDKQKEKKP